MAKIIVVGGGLTGMLMALDLAQRNMSVTLIAGKNWPGSDIKDDRTTAIMMENIDHLKKVGVWQYVGKEKTPLEVMNIVSKGKTYSYAAHEIDQEAFALNIDNRSLKQAFVKAVGACKNIDVLAENVKSVIANDKPYKACIQMENGSEVLADVVIGADGYSSIVRQSMGFAETKEALEQSALVCSFAHEKSHENESTEYHRAGGPFTVVPMAGNRSALVWCDQPGIIQEANKASNQDLSDVINGIVADRLGKVSDIQGKAIWPIKPMLANEIIGHRIALIGEASHALPPIAAQGFNLSMGDVRLLGNVLCNAIELGLDIGQKSILRTYQEKRHHETYLRYRIVNGLNQTLVRSKFYKKAQFFNSIGLSILEYCLPLRHAVMRFGMTPTDRKNRKGSHAVS